MKKLKEIFKKRLDLLVVCFLLILTIPSFSDTIKSGFFPMHDDLQVMRQLVMEKCFQDLQIPCRWSQDMGYGYGFPIFNYYPPLPFYFGQVFRTFGLQFVDIVKILVIISFVSSGLSMYFLAKEFWGRWGGLLSAILYIYAPYHAVDIYVRGAMNEAWALTWLPLIFLFIYKIIITNKLVYVPILALCSALLMLSHNPTLMIFAPAAIIWAFYWMWQNRGFKVFPKLIVGAIWALGLAAFFTLPVVVEQKDAHIETMLMGYFNYLAHFADIQQLFISGFWDYGPSVLGPGDGMSFQIGYLHWGLAIVSILMAAKLSKSQPKISLMILLIFFLTTFFTFMTHQKSSFIWSKIPQLEYLQFPWRFLTMTIFGASILGGSFIYVLEKTNLKKVASIIAIVISLGAIALYKDDFRWEKNWPWVTDQVKLSGELWKLQQTAGIFDYLPKSAPRPPGGPPNGDIEIIKGLGTTEKIIKVSNRQEYKVDITENALVQINTYYFPGWKYFINNKEVDYKAEPDLGRPLFELQPGSYLITAKLTNTPIRLLGNTISIIFWTLLFVVSLAKFLRSKTL